MNNELPMSVNPPRYLPRDLSWLDFNYRVLQEAMSSNVPLYERIKFLAIYSSNLDEFFRVRVAALRQFKLLQKDDRKRLLDIKPKRVLKEILALVQWQQEQFGRTLREDILPALEKKHIYLLRDEHLSDEQRDTVWAYYNDKVKPLLELRPFKAEDEPPFLENHHLYFIVDQGAGDWAVLNIPSDELPRFLELPSVPGTRTIIYLDDIIRICRQDFLGQHYRFYACKVSRDAELYIDDEFAGDLLAKIKSSLAGRDGGLPTRFLYDQRIPEELLRVVRKAYRLSKYDMVPGSNYHNFQDLFGFPKPTDQPDLSDPVLPPLPHPVLETEPSLMGCIRSGDQLLHFPYQKYDYIPALIAEAANDPDVERLRITLYRVASKSAVVEGLLAALANGKEVEVFVEAKARFDEASNLYWGEALREQGALVRYSFPGIKVHTKLLLIEARGNVSIAYLGTGNFNEKTAKLYADHALLTAQPALVADVRQVFEQLAGRLIMPATQLLLTAPFNLREKLLKKIDREIKHARAGQPAAITLKMNSLEERGMIDRLYAASNAGVKIRLIVRGICCLVSGVPGQSENIEVISIIDRFLEHARIFHFYNNGKEELYLASADWMNRNLFRRVEVAWPILDTELRQELKDFLELQWSDNVKARIIDSSQQNQFRAKTEPGVRAQVQFYEQLKALV